MDILIAARIHVPDSPDFERLSEKNKLKFLRSWIGYFLGDPAVPTISEKNPLGDDVPISTAYDIQRAR